MSMDTVDRARSSGLVLVTQGTADHFGQASRVVMNFVGGGKSCGVHRVGGRWALNGRKGGACRCRPS